MERVRTPFLPALYRIFVQNFPALFPPPTPISRSLESVDRERSTKPPPPNNYAIASADVSPLSRGDTDFVVRADMRPVRLRLPAGELASLVPPGAYIDASSYLTVRGVSCTLRLRVCCCSTHPLSFNCCVHPAAPPPPPSPSLSSRLSSPSTSH